VWVWRLTVRTTPDYLPALTVWLDVLFGAALIGNTGAHQSPFYLWIVFTIVGAGLKGGWGTVARVCLAELILYLYVALRLPSLDHSEFVLLGFLAWTVLLFAVALVLAHMGQRLLEQNRRLASLHQAAAHISAGRTPADILGRAADSLTDLLEAERVAAAMGEDGPASARPVFVNMNQEQGERLLRLARAVVGARSQTSDEAIAGVRTRVSRDLAAQRTAAGAGPRVRVRGDATAANADFRPHSGNSSAPGSLFPPAAGSLTLSSEAPHDELRRAGAGEVPAGVRSLLIIRLSTGPGGPGVLVACNRRGHRAFTAADEELAALLAALAAPLLETARRQDQRRFEAGGVERRRIAAELHDGLIQTLSGIDLRMLACRELWAARRWEALGGELQTLKGLVEEALAEARGAINELAPVRLRQGGLAAYLEAAIRQFEQRAGLSVAAAIDLRDGVVGSGSSTSTSAATEPVPEPTALLLIGLLREGLNNVRKHACASRVTLRIRRQGELIDFYLADDGAGFRADARPPAATRHYGLAYLREWIAAAGGELRVISRPGEGTVLEARLPLLTEARLLSLLSGDGDGE
jgi:signal transduction histidine kinase